MDQGLVCLRLPSLESKSVRPRYLLLLRVLLSYAL